MLRRIVAVLIARNREFYRDRAGLGWNILMPAMFLFGLAFIFSGEQPSVFKVGVLSDAVATDDGIDIGASPFLATKHLDLVPLTDQAEALQKVERHELDLLYKPGSSPAYWVNEHSQKGYFLEQLLSAAYQGQAVQPQRESVSGRALRYVDWVLPGILGVNIMFSCFWGVGWVIVRYRKNGVLRRLKATPLTAFEFLSAQILSRLLVVVVATFVVYLAADLFLDFVMLGSVFTLLVVFIAGAISLMSLGLIVASRLKAEELADGLLNLMSWPMMLLSGVWFSMEGTSEMARLFSELLPLTHLVNAARAVMIEGAGLVDLLPELAILAGSGLLMLLLAAKMFRWE